MTRPDYGLLLKLGEGGVGDVYLAEARGSGGFRKLVVIKCLKPAMLVQPAMRASFLEEARLCASLNHPNIVQVLGVFEEDGALMLTMEYLEGQNLGALLRDAIGGCPLALKLHAIAEVLEGLAYFHGLEDVDGVPLRPVHRDISPQNVIVTYEGGVKILDFGIAKSSVRTVGEVTESGVVKGKLHYMPPEQIFGGDIDARVDLYAVGVMLWQAAARRRMWEGCTEEQILSRVVSGQTPPLPDGEEYPAGLRAIIERALARSREDRFSSAIEMRSELTPVVAALDPSPQAPALRSYMQEHYAAERSAQLRRVRAARAGPRFEIPSGSLFSQEPSTVAASIPTKPGLGAARRLRRSPAMRWATIAVLGAITTWSAVLVSQMRARATALTGAAERRSAAAAEGVRALVVEEPVAVPCARPLLADFEDGWAHLCAAGATGRVVAYFDGTGSMSPPPGPYGPVALLATPRANSKRALHLAGKDLTDWGAGVAVPLDSGRPVDLSGMQGVAIWMRAEGRPVTVLVEIATAETLDVSFGGACRPTDNAICDDHYSAPRTVSVYWTLVRIPFAQLRQLGFGVSARFDPAHVLELHVAVKKDVLPETERARPLDFDLWIDDISLY